MSNLYVVKTALEQCIEVLKDESLTVEQKLALGEKLEGNMAFPAYASDKTIVAIDNLAVDGYLRLIPDEEALMQRVLEINVLILQDVNELLEIQNNAT